MSGSGAVHPMPAQRVQLWRELYVLSFGRNFGGQDKGHDVRMPICPVGALFSKALGHVCARCEIFARCVLQAETLNIYDLAAMCEVNCHG